MAAVEAASAQRKKEKCRGRGGEASHACRPDAWDGERGLGDVGGEDDLTCARRGRLEDERLLLIGQRAIDGPHKKPEAVICMRRRGWSRGEWEGSECAHMAALVGPWRSGSPAKRIRMLAGMVPTLCYQRLPPFPVCLGLQSRYALLESTPSWLILPVVICLSPRLSQCTSVRAVSD